VLSSPEPSKVHPLLSSPLLPCHLPYHVPNCGPEAPPKNSPMNRARGWERNKAPAGQTALGLLACQG
jgi:hypothetical protein